MKKRDKRQAKNLKEFIQRMCYDVYRSEFLAELWSQLTEKKLIGPFIWLIILMLMGISQLLSVLGMLIKYNKMGVVCIVMLIAAVITSMFMSFEVKKLKKSDCTTDEERRQVEQRRLFLRVTTCLLWVIAGITGFFALFMTEMPFLFKVGVIMLAIITGIVANLCYKIREAFRLADVTAFIAARRAYRNAHAATETTTTE